MKRQMDFWRNALAGIPEEITLPTDRRRPAVGSYRGGLVSVHLDSELHRGLVKLAHTCGASLFMVLQAGFAPPMREIGAGTDLRLRTVAARPKEKGPVDL